jgi:ribosome-associated toxin RatA of RatAB toxin-antitoxin module
VRNAVALAALIASAGCSAQAVAAPSDAARSHWLTEADRAAIDRRDVPVQATAVPDAGGGQRIRAAVRIEAPPKRVFAVMTDCARALRYVPGLELCQVLSAAPDRQWEQIEHRAKPFWFLPASTYVFRAEYEPDRSVRFRHVRGDFSRNEGAWELLPLDSASATLVTYEVAAELRAPVPDWVVTRALRRELPRLLRALRDYAEQEN